jgi:hypothetical protein
VLDAASDRSGHIRIAADARSVLAINATDAAQEHYLGGPHYLGSPA